jgi:hypothetical protein
MKEVRVLVKHCEDGSVLVRNLATRRLKVNVGCGMRLSMRAREMVGIIPSVVKELVKAE